MLQFSSKNPGRASEVIKYMCNICTAANSFVWDNVYMYDVNFRQLMEKYPYCNWGINCKQGWTTFVMDKLDKSNQNSFHSSNKHKPCLHDPNIGS